MDVYGQTYYRHEHIFYRPIIHRGRTVYIECPPPAGATVIKLPPKHKTVIVKGRKYYVSGPTHYMKVKRDGRTVYRIVRRPN